MSKALIPVFLLLSASIMAEPAGFLFVTFQREMSQSSEQVYFALSQDGRNWTSLNGAKPVLVSDIGKKGARDPFLLRSKDGTGFYLLATDLSIYSNPDWTRAVEAGSRSILIWESADLVHWSSPRLAAVAPADAGCAWAPEAIYDENTGDYLLFWAGTSSGDNYRKQRIWACRTADFRSFGAPFPYIEKMKHVIDADIVKDGNLYYRFFKDETRSVLGMETSAALTGPWTRVPGFTLSGKRGYEGPECYRLSDKTWCLIADHYMTAQGYEPFVTDDLAKGSFKPGEGFTFPFPFRHGSVLPLLTGEYSRLETAYPPARGGD